jgi:hypothetical protein
MKRPTASQRQALEDIERHGDPWARVHGQSQHGGWNGVMCVIKRENWAFFSEDSQKWELTEDGKKALKEKP